MQKIILKYIENLERHDERKRVISNYITETTESKVKIFLADFIDFINLKPFDLLDELLVFGNKFFGKYVILITAGESILYNDNILIGMLIDHKKTCPVEKKFPEGKNLPAISNEIFQKLNLIRY